MCQYHAQRSPQFRANQHRLTKEFLTPREERALKEFQRQFADVLDGPQRDLLQKIRAGQVDFSRLSSVRADVNASFGQYANDIEVVYRENLEEGVAAGRQAAARRFNLDGSFDQVPNRLLEELDDWSIESRDEVVDSMSDEVARTIRGAAEDGKGRDEIVEIVDNDVFENRLKTSKTEEVVQTEMTSASNTGAHSSYADSGAIAEEWLSANQPDRTREAHLDADGQIVPIDGTFLVGGEQMLHPGDKSASIELWARCRCSVAPVFREDLTASQLETIEDGGRIGA